VNGEKSGTVIPVIAIDGPTASGKGTVAQQVAERLGYHYLDSGSLYRLAALAAVRQGLALDAAHEAAIAKIARALKIRFASDKIFLSDQDVSNEIRTETAGQNASIVAAFPLVREALLQRQRDFREMPGLVCDGRDMASVVFPDAALKVFLTASVDARAERRTKQLKQKGMSAIMDDVVKELRIRDDRDMNRPVAPLKRLSDAQLLDTTEISANEAVDRIISWYQG
jgi:cytidylate kinase